MIYHDTLSNVGGFYESSEKVAWHSQVNENSINRHRHSKINP
jgi:hypothetical protein